MSTPQTPRRLGRLQRPQQQSLEAALEDIKRMDRRADRPADRHFVVLACRTTLAMEPVALQRGPQMLPESRVAGNPVSTASVYDLRYQGDYRENLSGYEFARWEALDGE